MKIRIIILIILVFILLIIPGCGLSSTYYDTWSNPAPVVNGTYDFTGNLLKTTNDTVMLFCREGTSHVGGPGKLFKMTYNLNTKTWSPRTYVYIDPDPKIDPRNIASGIINGKIYIFISRFNISQYDCDIGYINSTDLTGTTWSDYHKFPIAPTGISMHGHIIPTSDQNEYLVPYYIEDNPYYTVGYLKTSDGGSTWTNGTIYYGTHFYDETTLDYIGNGKIIALIRDEDGGPLAQSISLDNGNTWSAPTATNLGVPSGIKVPYSIYDNETGQLLVIFTDRGDGYTKISVSNASTVCSYPTGYVTAQKIEPVWLGYPSIIKLSTGSYFYNCYDELNANLTSIVSGYYSESNNRLTSPIKFIRSERIIMAVVKIISLIHLA
jgi:hypothetical protein